MTDPLRTTTTASRRLDRRGTLALTLLLAVLATMLVVQPARAAGDEAAELTSLIGQARASAGVAGLTVSGDLVDVATRHAQRMASEGRLYHNPNLGQEVQGWQRLGENVGHGGDPRAVHDAFMASPDHRANILDADVTQLGVGVARGADGSLWVTEVFRLPTSSSPAPSPAPTTEAPAPAPEPQPTAAPAAPAPAPDPTPVAEAPAEPVLDFELGDVGPAPEPRLVGPADEGTVVAAPSPATFRLTSVVGWLVTLVTLLEG